MDIESRKEMYITQIVKTELGEIKEPAESDTSARVCFWQNLSTGERMCATTEIVRRVHIARGGKEDDLKLKRNVVRLVRR